MGSLVRQELTQNAWSMIVSTAPVLHKSRLFATASEEQAAAIMLKGYELGLTLTASFEFIHIIQGKPTISPRGALALIYQCGELAGIKIEDDGKTCKVWMKRTNGVEHVAMFGMDDAKTAGLLKGGGAWEMYPRQMRQWRAVGFCADVVFPDVIGGLKRSDELGATVTEDGNVVEGSWKEGGGRPPLPPQNGHGDRLQKLLDRHGAEAVMTANDGMIPVTAEEIAVVAQKLQTAMDGMTLAQLPEVEF